MQVRTALPKGNHIGSSVTNSLSLDLSIKVKNMINIICEIMLSNYAEKHNKKNTRTNNNNYKLFKMHQSHTFRIKNMLPRFLIKNEQLISL